jgi:hypothetical protein
MRRPFVLIAAAALGSGWIASDAGANAVTFVATGPTTIEVDDTTTFDVVVQIDPDVSGATFHVDVSGLGILSATNDMTGTNGLTANFSLRQPSFAEWPGPTCFGDPDPTCVTIAPGAPLAGNAGGLSASTFTSGTYTIGSYTVVGTSEGTGTVEAIVEPGLEWVDGGPGGEFNLLPNPTSNVLEITVIPEPGLVVLLASGVVGLAVLGRSRRRG